MKAARSVLVLLLVAIAAATAHAESLYREGQYRPLAGDHKAHRVGDAVTIQVLESSSASTSTDTNTQRRNNLGGSLTHPVGPSNGFALSVNGDFTGGGTTQRENRLLATLTVTVREVLANGDLQLAGEQVVVVNGERHHVVVEGRARPLDISDANVLVSSRLADARITYVGDGDLSERQKRSLWRSIADWLGL